MDAAVTTTEAGRDEDPALGGIGDRIREERTRAGISQRELARRLGLSASMISQIESGHTLPSVATLWSIVTELDLSSKGRSNRRSKRISNNTRNKKE